jgi:hypothetical protein
MSHPLDGCFAKISRAEELANLLLAELERLKPAYSVVSTNDIARKRFIFRVEGPPVPLRIPILVGEILHQFRSVFDHIAWAFAMLRALAGKNETMSDVLRDLVRREYRRRFGDTRPERSPAPTLRGIIEDVAGPIHFTAGNIAERTGLPLKAILHALEQLARRRLVERIDKQGTHSTWESRFGGGAERLLDEAERAGFVLDADLTDTPIKDWTPRP